MNKIKTICAGLAIALSICILGVAATLTQQYIVQQKAEERYQAPPRYGIQGLPYDTELSMTPIFTDDDYFYYKDRTVTRYLHAQEKVDVTVDALTMITKAIPSKVKQHVMLVPLRVAIEDVDETDADDMHKAITQIYAKLPNHINRLDIEKALMEHREEYIYFRTDDSWTALGAYYAAMLFCEQAGFDGIPLDLYEENKFEFYIGTSAMTSKADELNIEDFPDYVSYYIQPDAVNWQLVSELETGDAYRVYESPAVALSRRGTNVFLGGNISHSILQGDSSENRTLLIIGDSLGKRLAPWLTPYYEHVYYISVSFYQEWEKGFDEIFQRYNVTDSIIIEGADNFGNSIENKRTMRYLRERTS